MTESLKPLIVDLCSQNVAFFTGPADSPRSINNDDDAISSAIACLPSLTLLLAQYDGFLVACYSRHPLVWQLRDRTNKPVIGIFESSITTALHLLRPGGEKFGIVSTGLVWESLLSVGVNEAFGVDGGSSIAHFAGVETTGLNATDLHDSPVEEVRGRMMDATKRLLGRGAKVICLGCAGMAGMGRIVRDACVQELGEEQGPKVRIVDGIKSGLVVLDGLVQLV
ncbi:hypothetical protein FGG08_005877 [Glutinoglossum americanum]|uniref:Hydantoin racemase n=1 Tax=Glutinoglossum americanum TaxID=1670608 RepID=A0A9P8I263_9PEZI|nr:hypothetical protein FGG08_005877 [Glutinoglossum americanum]